MSKHDNFGIASYTLTKGFELHVTGFFFPIAQTTHSNAKQSKTRRVRIEKQEDILLNQMTTMMIQVDCE